MLKRIYESVSKVSDNYNDHNLDMEQLISSIELENKTYEGNMNDIIHTLSTPPLT